MQNEIIVIIGLGNFPPQYKYTKHNIGKDLLLFIYNDFNNKKFYSSREEIINNKTCLFIIPNTYMNTSSQIFQDQNLKKIYMSDSKINTIIIHDDLELPFTKYKFRNNKDRGPRGHNGNRSIIKELQNLQKEKYTQPFYFSIGIDRPKDGKVDSFVLQKFNIDEITQLENIIFNNSIKELINNIKNF
jgi:PTH1 family peptidyl-tRNA hydrolase